MANRKFDWDEARRLYAEGVSITRIAARCGVSWSAIQRVVVPGRAEAMRATNERWMDTHREPCIEGCGRMVSYIGARYHGGRCTECASITRSTTARPGELECVTCKEWKPDDEFPRNSKSKHARRGRHGQCRVCQTIARRDHRRRNREADKAYQRAYYRRRKAESV